jgi:hypothetical protein
MDFLRWPAHYYIDDVFVRQDEEEPPPLSIGSGLVWSDGERYRVVDIWFSYDKRGALDWGMHVYLELVDDDDDRPRHLNPRYYTPRPS